MDNILMGTLRVKDHLNGEVMTFTLENGFKERRYYKKLLIIRME